MRFQGRRNCRRFLHCKMAQAKTYTPGRARSQICFQLYVRWYVLRVSFRFSNVEHVILAGAETVRLYYFDIEVLFNSLSSPQTAVTVHVFFLLMAMFPEIQRKAQAELESVIGKDRLPSFEDRDRLTYVEAVCKEVMRYHAVVPNGEYFSCSGYHKSYWRHVPTIQVFPIARLQTIFMMECSFPKALSFLLTSGEDWLKSMALTMHWVLLLHRNMTHDPEVYKNPMEFNPERFLGESPEQDPKDMVFGFGRRLVARPFLLNPTCWAPELLHRICPGAI